jgi:hypothetical protein
MNFKKSKQPLSLTARVRLLWSTISTFHSNYLSAVANAGWTSFFSTSGNRKRVQLIVAIAFFSQLSANGLVSYYLNKVLTSIDVTWPTIQVLSLHFHSRML